MKKTVLIFVVLLLVISCSVRKKPVFIKVDDIKVLSFKTDTIHLQAKAYFKNENDIGGKIATDGIKVFVDGKEMAEVFSDEFKVPANKEFAIPLQIKISSKKVFNQGILGGLLNSVLNKGLKVRLKGDLKYKIFGYSNVYPIDKTEKIKVKI